MTQLDILTALALAALFLLIALNEQVKKCNRRMEAMEAALARLASGTEPPIEATVAPDVLDCIKSNDLIHAIRLYRQHTGASLLEAEQAVKAIRSQLLCASPR